MPRDRSTRASVLANMSKRTTHLSHASGLRADIVERMDELSKFALTSEAASAIQSMYVTLTNKRSEGAGRMKGLRRRKTAAVPEAAPRTDSSPITSIAANPSLVQAKKRVEIDTYMEALDKSQKVAAEEVSYSKGVVSERTSRQRRKPTRKPKSTVRNDVPAASTKSVDNSEPTLTVSKRIPTTSAKSIDKLKRTIPKRTPATRMSSKSVALEITVAINKDEPTASASVTKMSSKSAAFETSVAINKDEPIVSDTPSTPTATASQSTAPLSARVNKILSDLRMLLSDYSILSCHFLDPNKKATLDANKVTFSVAGEIGTDPYLVEFDIKMTKLLGRVIRLEATGLEEDVVIAKLKALEDKFMSMEAKYKVDLAGMKALKKTLEIGNGSAGGQYTKYAKVKGVSFQMIGNPEDPVAAAPEVKVEREKRKRSSTTMDDEDSDDEDFKPSEPSRKKRKSSTASSKVVSAAESSTAAPSQDAGPSFNSVMPFRIFGNSPESSPPYTAFYHPFSAPNSAGSIEPASQFNSVAPASKTPVSAKPALKTADSLEPPSKPVNSVEQASKTANSAEPASKAADFVEPTFKSVDFLELSMADCMKLHNEMKAALADVTLAGEERNKLKTKYDENKALIKVLTKQIEEAMESDVEMDDGIGEGQGKGKQVESSA